MNQKIFYLIISLFQAANSLACTIFIASDGHKVLVGNNEDYSPTIKTFLWVRPAQENKNGYIFWGFEEKYPEGGMNDKGLFYDVASLPQKVDLVRDPQKEDFEGYIVEKVLQECGSVDDVIKLVSKYNLIWYEKAQIMVADKSGDYAIINASYIIHPNESEYVLTNYNLNDPANKDFKCWRRNTAYQLLNANPVSVESFTNILDKTAQRETDNGTVYSQVCDLKNNIIYLYQRHDFTEVNKISLSLLLKKGRQDIEIKNLFPVRISDELVTIYDENGIEKTLIQYETERQSINHGYTFTENELVKFGYQLIDSNKVADAIKLLTLNLKYYPNSEKANVALANAYLIDGKEKDANKLYSEVLKLNPSNYYLTLFGKNNGSITFRFKGMQGAKKIALVGSFNNYDPKANLFTKTEELWTCNIRLLPGVYSYKFVVDDRYWIQDPLNELHIKPKDWWDSYLKVQ
jgi:tetratricopeptide (TPR) repeat protein